MFIIIRTELQAICKTTEYLYYFSILGLWCSTIGYRNKRVLTSTSQIGFDYFGWGLSRMCSWLRSLLQSTLYLYKYCWISYILTITCWESYTIFSNSISCNFRYWWHEYFWQNEEYTLVHLWRSTSFPYGELSHHFFLIIIWNMMVIIFS